MRGDVHEARAFGHDRPGAVHEMRQRQKLGDFYDDGVCPLKRKPDAGEKHHGPGEQVQEAAGQFLARKTRGTSYGRESFLP